jgi:hypothetical protein
MCGVLIEAIEIRSRGKADRCLPCVRRRDRFRGVGFAQDNPRPSLLDRLFPRFPTVNALSKGSRPLRLFPRKAVENSAPVITSSLAG